MKQTKSLVLLLLLLANGNMLYAQNKNVKEESDSYRMQKLMQQYSIAVENYDTAFIETIFDDEMIVTSAGGRHRNKQQEINDLLYKVPELTLEYFVTEKLNFINRDKASVVYGVLKWKFKEKEEINRRSFTFTFIKSKKNWKILAQHIGQVPS